MSINLLISNVFLFFGFFFMLLIHRRNTENICILLDDPPVEGSNQKAKPVRPAPGVWFILCFISFVIAFILRYVDLSAFVTTGG